MKKSAQKNSTSSDLKRAVALFYDGELAPTLSAKGEGAIAEEIIRLAEENEVPLCDNGPLVELLSELSLGDEIPEALYHAIAHIIAFAYDIRLQCLTMNSDQAGGKQTPVPPNPQ